MTVGISPINRAFNLIPKRAEQRQADRLRETFIDSGVAIALESSDHQVLYGRRGTGKTHALRFMETQLRESGDVAIYIDLRTIGSAEGLFMGERIHDSDRASRLLVDLLNAVHDEVLRAALNDDSLSGDVAFVDRLDGLLAAISTVRIDGTVESSSETESRSGSSAGAGANISIEPTVAGVGVSGSYRDFSEEKGSERRVRSGVERISLNFSDIARALRRLADSIQSKRVWLLLDEWSSVPFDIQPMLGEFLVRCITPNPEFTVKIAAIEQQANFRASIDGRAIGIELGADFAANVNLDEFMVHEQDADRSIQFFRDLMFKHLSSGAEQEDRVPDLVHESDLIRIGFTDRRAFEELVRAAEGVPRDAINIAAKAAMRAGSRRISVNDVRSAAQAWFQTDKEAALRNISGAPELLNWIIDKVIRGKMARGFLVNQRSANSALLLALFDARVLHLVRRGYSAQDEPGERYDVWVIDFGAYVDLIHTKYEPQQLVLPGQGFHAGGLDAGEVEVPLQDLRAIRRAVLDLTEFEARYPE